MAEQSPILVSYNDEGVMSLKAFKKSSACEAHQRNSKPTTVDSRLTMGAVASVMELLSMFTTFGATNALRILIKANP